MKTQPLGRSDIQVSRLAYGCMRISVGSWDRNDVTEETIRGGIRSVEAAFEAGYTFFDHADIYGDTTCETIFGRALALHPGWRERMVIATKCGIRWEDEPRPGAPHRYDFSHEHIVRSAEASLARLGIETIDLFQLHRPDLLADPAEIARAFTQLREQGKVREFGVSNFRPTLVSAVQKALPFALQVNQVEIHLGRLDCLTDGTLDQCLELGMTPLSWSPLGGGWLATGSPAGPINATRIKREFLLRELDAVATQLGRARTLVALAWLMRRPSRIVPIVGSADAGRIRAMAAADDLELDRETWYRLTLAARGEKLP